MIYKTADDNYERVVFADTGIIKLVNYDDAMINAYLDLGHGMYRTAIVIEALMFHQ